MRYFETEYWLSVYPVEDKTSAGRQINGGAIANGSIGKWYGSGEVGLLCIDASMAAESRRIAVEDKPVFTGFEVNGIIREGLCRVEAEKEDEAGALESQQLIRLMLEDQLNLGRLEKFVFGCDTYHSLIEFGKKPVAKILVVEQVPLAARISVRPVVALPGKIYPFRMAELVAHEVQITAARSNQGDQSYHLVQGHAAVHP